MRRTIAEVTLSAAAAPNPWTARTTRRNGRLFAKKHKAVATVNSSCPDWYSRRSPMRSPSADSGSRLITSTSW